MIYYVKLTNADISKAFLKNADISIACPKKYRQIQFLPKNATYLGFV